MAEPEFRVAVLGTGAIAQVVHLPVLSSMDGVKIHAVCDYDQPRAQAIANRFGVPYIAVIGNNSAMNQIRYGQITKYGEERGSVGNLLGDVPFSKFAEMLGGYGEEVRDPAMIAPALERAREAVAKSGKSAVVNIWVDPREYAPGTKNQTMYK